MSAPRGIFAAMIACALATGCTSPLTSADHENAGAARFSHSHTTLPYFLEYPIGNKYPSGIVLGPDGAMWFTEGSGSSVGRIDVFGQFTEFNVGRGQEDIGVGYDKNLWFSTTGSRVIGRLTTGGILKLFYVPKPVVTLESIGRGPDKRMWFTDIAVDRSTAYIGAIGPSGKITLYGPVDAPCYFPFGLAAGADGNLWATGGGRCLMKVAQSGLITTYQEDPTRDMSYLIDGGDGYLWVSDDSNSQPDSIDQVTYSGQVTYHYVADPASGIYGLAQVGNDIYFVEVQANRIGRFDKTTYAVTQYDIPTPNSNPHRLAVGPDKNIWFTEASGNKIGVLVIH